VSTAFVSGTRAHPVHVTALQAPHHPANRLPVVMLHGGFHTGHTYLQTPDGREGWAPWFARQGHPVFVPDWPGHGQSPRAGDLADLGSTDIRDAMAELLAHTGPCVLVAHSAGGPIAWALAEHRPHTVKAIVGIAPGAPANLVPVLPDDAERVARLSHDVAAGCPVHSPPGQPVRVDRDFIGRYWANAPRFPRQAFDAYVDTVVAESPRVLNERFNIGGQGLALREPALVGRRPILVLTGECDPRHPEALDAALARFLGADFLWLPRLGITGNGHMPMIENNSEAIARLVLDWLRRHGF
jgi:pimeloyl-ACP methyl ester carboxylesterase